MDDMTVTDYKIEDHHQTRYEACYDTALNEYWSTIEPIKQKFEHHLNDEPVCDIDFNVFRLFTVCVESMKLKANYTYKDDYDEVEYDFTKELRAMLLDEYGWEV